MTDVPVKTLRYPIKTAAKVLGVTPDAVRTLAKAGTLTPIYPAGTGKGKKIYLHPAEVEAYATGGLAGVVKYREKLAKRKPKA